MVLVLATEGGARESVCAPGRLDGWPDDIPGSGVRRSALLAADASAARVARVFAAAVLADWRLSALTDDVCVCVSELVSNAYRHAEADATAGRGDRPRLIRLTLHLHGRCLRVQVRDGDPRGPVLWPSPNGAELPESGHGLRIVQGLSAGWAWWRLGVGKVVECWFTADCADMWT
jgi:anti-sigma regulatory factor (Ser/Thr protein kinase)